MEKSKLARIVKYLNENDILVCISKDCDGNDCYELESFTDAGGDMIINLDELTSNALLDYINNFDINEEVLQWWPNGQPSNQIPFENIRDHYNDVENWCNYIKDVANNWCNI